jgi:bile acid:Na+ symporter, BASS family
MAMTIDRWINLLVTLTLVEMMAAIGMSVSLSDATAAARDWRLMLRATIANYVLVPLATVALLLLFQAKPMAAAGFLILAACPGAPYGPPLTAIARANVAASVGLMVVLAASSALVAPLMLRATMPLISSETTLEFNAGRLAGTLLATQLAPLCVGIGLRLQRPALAARLLPAANLISKVLNLATIGLILAVQFRLFLEIRPIAFVGMFALLLASLTAGWLLGGPTVEGRKTMALTTSLRNAGVSMVIAAGSFPGTQALTAVLAYALIEVIGSLALAIWWRRQASTRQSLSPADNPTG